MNDIIFALWFFLPAGIANVTPVIVAHMPILKELNYPLDGYKKINNIRIFGDHKTVRGIISGCILGTVTAIILFPFSHNFQTILPSWYFTTNIVWLGFLLSLGALLGDAIKSFFKRQMKIQPGKTWIPFDQIDYIIGGLFFASFVHILPIQQYITILIIWIIIHVLSTYSGYFLHLKNQPL